MGCDIHVYKEKHVDGRWVTADEWVAYDYGEGDRGQRVPWEKQFSDRNYQLFGLLSKGVRTTHPFSLEPRGLPFNPCSEVAAVVDGRGEDGHGHSYLYLHELRDLAEFLKTQPIRITGMKDTEGLAALQASIDSGNPDWDLLFPYCGWCSAPGYVEFSLDVPASYYVGAGLDEIISGFDGVDGDNHRIVFFFDN